MVILIGPPEGVTTAGERSAASVNGEQNGAPILILTTTGAPHERLLLRRIAHSADDSEEHLSDGRIEISSGDLELGEEGAGDRQAIGVRWLDINIPRGST